MQFDHEKLDVYQVSLELVAFVINLAEDLDGKAKHMKDQLVRASQSIPLNIAEGNGKRRENDRRRYFDIARGSAMECAAGFDVLVAIGSCTDEQVEAGKVLLKRVVSMLSKMTDPRDGFVKEEEGEYVSNL